MTIPKNPRQANKRINRRLTSFKRSLAAEQARINLLKKNASRADQETMDKIINVYKRRLRRL